MSDLIKREDALKAIEPIIRDILTDKTNAFKAMCIPYKLNALPSVDRPQGEWIWGNEKKSWHRCSVCGEQAYSYYDELADNVEELFNYCPNCGAKMKGADDERGR